MTRSARQGVSRAWLVAVVAVAPYVVVRAGTMGESDTFWAVRTGLLTIEQRGIPRVDPFSWTAQGRPWSLHSWGFNVVLGAVHRLGGLPLVALACGAVVVAIAWCALVLARRLGASPAVAAAVLAIAIALLTVHLSARPQIVDYVFVPLLVMLLLRLVEDRPSVWTVVGIGALMVTWVNLHSAALLGVAIIGATTVIVAARPETRDRAVWCAAALAAATAGSLVNPYGIGLFEQSLHVRDSSTDVIVEWRSPDPANPLHMLVLAAGVLALVLAARGRHPVFTAALAVAAVGSLTATRFLPILLLLAVPVLAAAASTDGVLRYVHSRRVMLARGAILLVLAFVVLAVPALTHLGRPDPSTYPSAVVDAIPTGCRLYNSYLLGGYVILERPDVLVSIDSRNDLYGAPAVSRNVAVVAGAGDVDGALDGAGCVLVPPDSGLARQLAEGDDWEQTALDSAGVLFVRR